MNFGTLATFPKQEPAGGGPPGPPFALNSAAEGISIDPVTGQIVLGTDGSYGTPDAFTVARILEAANLPIILQDTTSGGPGQGSFNIIGSDRNLISSPSGNIGLQSIYSDVALQFVLFDFLHLAPALTLATGFNDVTFGNLDGLQEIVCNAQSSSVRMDMVNRRMMLFDPAIPDNGQTVQVNGNLSLLNDGTLAAVAFPLTAPFSSSDIDFGLFSCNPGDMVLIGVDPASVLPNSFFSAYVSSPGNVRLRFNNYSAAAQTPPVGNFTVSIIKIT